MCTGENGYVAILERLLKYCDRVSIATDVNGDEDLALLEKLKPYFLYSEWKRHYPGSTGRGNVKLFSYRMCPEVIAVFKKYHSFIDTGYDMAFYQGKSVVLFVLFHEDWYYVEEKYKKYFEDILYSPLESASPQG